jgi:glucose dehydrogenase
MAVGAGSAMAQDDGRWPVPGQNLAGFRYSPLDQMNTENVKGLAVA